MNKLDKVINFITEHCSVIGTPRKNQLIELVKDLHADNAEVAADLSEQLEAAEEENAELTQNVVIRLEGHHANLRTQMVLQSLSDNLDEVNIAELEKFIDQYSKLK